MENHDKNLRGLLTIEGFCKYASGCAIQQNLISSAIFHSE